MQDLPNLFYLYPDQVACKIPFPEIVSSEVLYGDETVTVSTIRSENFTFKSSNSKEIKDLITYFVEGLKKRSIYVVAVRDYRPPDDPKLLSFKKGDLIKLNDSFVNESGSWMACPWYEGKCLRDGKSGKFPKDFAVIIPGIGTPDTELIELYSGESMYEEEEDDTIIESGYVHTLEKYSMTHFRPISSSNLFSPEEGILWQYSQHSIKQPLLKKVSTFFGQ